jgi:hypothetical protein
MCVFHAKRSNFFLQKGGLTRFFTEGILFMKFVDERLEIVRMMKCGFYANPLILSWRLREGG